MKTLSLASKLAFACVLAACGARPARQQPLVIGIVTWVGYGPLYIAQDQGFFEREGVNVKIKIMDGPGEREAAFLGGSIDLFPNTVDAFAIFATRNAAGQIIMPMDESRGADGLVAARSITSVSELRGKRVGFQQGITSHFFLLYLLDLAGMSSNDIERESLGAGEAGAAFLAGKLDAAVTWEPWLTKVRENPNSRILKSSADTPGLLVSLLMVQPKIFESRRNDLEAFARAWHSAIAFLEENPGPGVNLIANAFALEHSETAAMLKTVHFLTPGEAIEYFDGSSDSTFSTTAANAVRLYRAAGVLDEDIDLSSLITNEIISTLRQN